MSDPTENRTFDVYPRVVPADAETDIAILPRTGPGALHEGDAYGVTLRPMENQASGNERAIRASPTGNALRMRPHFAGEQEHLLFVERQSGSEKTLLGECRVYSLAPDLFDRRPFKGDFHLHSARSDGREPPAHVAAACRRIGLDFMAVTDHWNYAPSLEAVRAFDGVAIDLRVFPGEEVHHTPPCPVHIVNFGGRFSVNALIAEQTEYLAAVRAIEPTIGGPPMSPERTFHYAQCLWTYRKIREAGGLAIFCHPYWFEGRGYNVPEELIARHLSELPCDAYELIGGYFLNEVESNALQVARYHEERSRGRQLPIVGASDSHGCERGELFGWYYSIVFAPSPELPDLVAGVRDLYAVAVESLPGATPRAHGPFRLVKYAQFLLREVFPQHDSLCVEEGRLMMGHIAGDPAAAAGLRRLSGRTRAWIDRCRGVTGEGTPASGAS